MNSAYPFGQPTDSANAYAADSSGAYSGTSSDDTFANGLTGGTTASVGSGTGLLQRRLRRSSTQNLVGGVLSGIGETYNINTTLLRVGFIASMLLPGPQLLAYAAAWLIMPSNTTTRLV